MCEESMKCVHCGSENLGERYVKSIRPQKNKTKRYFRLCIDCGYNSYYVFPSYLPEEQFDMYVEQNTKKGEK